MSSKKSGKSLPSSVLDYLRFEESIHPLRRVVLIRQDRRILIRRSGVVLPGSQDWAPQVGWVVSVAGKATEVKVGDYVIYEIYAGPEFEADGQRYILVNELDIVAVLDE